MSEQESRFIRQLKITLISVLGPFILVVAASGVNDHYKIRNNQEHINVIESAMVDQKLMMQFVDELRRMNHALEMDLDGHCAETAAEVIRINARIDVLIREVYQHNTRGVPQELR